RSRGGPARRGRRAGSHPSSSRGSGSRSWSRTEPPGAYLFRPSSPSGPIGGHAGEGTPPGPPRKPLPGPPTPPPAPPAPAPAGGVRRAAGGIAGGRWRAGRRTRGSRSARAAPRRGGPGCRRADSAGSARTWPLPVSPGAGDTPGRPWLALGQHPHRAEALPQVEAGLAVLGVADERRADAAGPEVVLPLLGPVVA